MVYAFFIQSLNSLKKIIQCSCDLVREKLKVSKVLKFFNPYHQSFICFFLVDLFFIHKILFKNFISKYSQLKFKTPHQILLNLCSSLSESYFNQFVNLGFMNHSKFLHLKTLF